MNASTRLRKLIDVKGIIEKMQQRALEGNDRAAAILLERALPPLRAIAEPVTLPGVTGGSTLTQKAERIVALTATGQLSPDVATALLGAIAQLAKVAEIDELTRRIEELEKRNGKSAN